MLQEYRVAGCQRRHEEERILVRAEAREAPGREEVAVGSGDVERDGEGLGGLVGGPAGTCSGAFAIVAGAPREVGFASAAAGLFAFAAFVASDAGSEAAAFAVASSSPISAANSANSSSIAPRHRARDARGATEGDERRCERLGRDYCASSSVVALVRPRAVRERIGRTTV